MGQGSTQHESVCPRAKGQFPINQSEHVATGNDVGAIVTRLPCQGDRPFPGTETDLMKSITVLRGVDDEDGIQQVRHEVRLVACEL